MAINLVGKSFNRLTVIDDLPRKNGRRRILCECACGNRKEFWAENVTSGKSLSCGCLRDALISQVGKANKRHGQSVNATPEYRAWHSIIQRCLNPSSQMFKHYGGRGIGIYPEWRNDFGAFFAAVGKRPSSKHSLDRIDNEKGYEPGNVRWATAHQQNSNRRSNNIVEIDGQRMTLADAIRLKGQRSNVVRQRLALGWPLERALNEKIVPRANRGRKANGRKSPRTGRDGRAPVL